jgi:hypothetical protein
VNHSGIIAAPSANILMAISQRGYLPSRSSDFIDGQSEHRRDIEDIDVRQIRIDGNLYNRHGRDGSSFEKLKTHQPSVRNMQ